MNRLFTLREFIKHMEWLRVNERKADMVARGAVAKHITVLAQRRLGKPSLLRPTLAESTMNRRAALGYPRNQPLLMTGNLRTSISWAHTGSRETGIGSSAPYSVYQELGGRIFGRPPKRSFLAATVQDSEHLLFRTYCQTYREILGL